MRVHNWFAVVFSFISLLLTAFPSYAEVNAYLNRYNITAQETVSLTIEATQQGPVQRPDLSLLTHDFTLLGSKKMTISSLRNGNRQATTRWQVLLRPRRSGELTIPAIQINGERSFPITLTVIGGGYANTPQPPNIGAPGISNAQTLNANPALSSQLPSIKITTEIDHTEAYEGSQLLYTVTMQHNAPLDEQAVLSDPFLNQALILPMGEKQTKEIKVRGVPYTQEKQVYVVFPDQPGTHIIEPPLFAGSLSGGQYVEVLGDPIEIAIIPRANDNSEGYWLPAIKLSINDEFDRPDRLEPGMSIERTLTMTAHGLPASRLPSLMVLNNELVDLELVNTELNESFDDQGLVGTRIERVRITFRERGEVTLPPIDIHWWDTEDDRAQVASLPPAILRVEGSRANLPVVSSDVTTKTPSENKEGSPLTDLPEVAGENTGVITLIILLASISIISSLGWLYAYNRIRKLRAANSIEREILNEKQKEKREKQLVADEQAAFASLQKACLINNPDLAQSRLLEWAALFWPESHIYNGRDISSAAQNKTLEFLIIDLEQQLYSTSSEPWQGDLLIQALEGIRDRKIQRGY